MSQQAADVGILGTFTFASIIPSCSFTFARIIPSCSFTFASVIPTLFSFFIKTFLLLSWSNEDGIRTVVEVIQQNRWVVVTMYHNKDITRPVEYSKHHSAVIRLVLELQKELAPNLDTFECLISPSLLQQWPLEHLPESDLFTITDVAKSVLLHKPVILSCKDGSNQLSTETALLFEPYHLLSSSSVCELMESDQPVSSALLNEVRECCQQPQLESQSHLSLREHLDSMSIFTGRNPLVSRSLYT